MRDVKFSSKKNHVFLVAVVTTAMLGAMLYSLTTGKDLAQRYAPLQDAAMEIKLETTTAHLWFEEAISGDQGIELKNIWNHLDQAVWYAKAMLDGGENHEGKFLPLEDPDLRQKINTTIAAVQAFQAIAVQRWANRATSGVGSSLDQRFDKAFKDVILLADNVETSLQRQMRDELQRFSLLQKILIGTTLILGILAGVLLRNNAKNLSKANDELEKKVAERTRDLTQEVIERKQAEKKAEAANHAKSSFLSAMSHELRTPLNAILGFGQLLASDDEAPLSEKQKVFAGHILNGGDTLTNLIDKILTFSDISDGAMAFKARDVTAREIVDKCLEISKNDADKHEIKLIREQFDEDLPQIRIDPIYGQEILLTYLSNSILYNRAGGEVRIGATLEKEDRLQITVVDTGNGIPQEKHAEVFLPFHRLHMENSSISGSGVGLAIAKASTELMGGTVGFESREGKGSSFWAEFPVVSQG